MSKNKYEISFTSETKTDFPAKLVERATSLEDKELQEVILSLASDRTITVSSATFAVARGFLAQIHKELNITVPMVMFRKHSEIPLDKSLVKKEKKVKVFKPTRRSFFMIQSFNPTNPGMHLEWFCRNFDEAKEKAKTAAAGLPFNISGIVTVQEYKLDSNFSREIVRYTTEPGSSEVTEMLVPLVPEPKKAKAPKEDAPEV